MLKVFQTKKWKDRSMQRKLTLITLRNENYYGREFNVYERSWLGLEVEEHYEYYKNFKRDILSKSI